MWWDFCVEFGPDTAGADEVVGGWAYATEEERGGVSGWETEEVGDMCEDEDDGDGAGFCGEEECGEEVGEFLAPLHQVIAAFPYHEGYHTTVNGDSGTDDLTPGRGGDVSRQPSQDTQGYHIYSSAPLQDVRLVWIRSHPFLLEKLGV